MARGKFNKRNTGTGSINNPNPVRDDTNVEPTKKAKERINPAPESNSETSRPVERDVDSIREEIVVILKQHCPTALTALDGLLENYAGREEDLLREAKEKYLKRGNERKEDIHWPSEDFQWKFTLKYFPMKPDDKKQNWVWATDESLKKIQPVLDERANSIGGECKMEVLRSGQRTYVVQRNRSAVLYDKGTVTATVEAMQQLVHQRYKVKEGRPCDVGNEHERRKLEKERDQNRKRGKEKRSVAAKHCSLFEWEK